MSGSLRRQALNIYKKLNKTRLKTFQGDENALKITKQKLQDEFKKNKNVTNEASIKELIKFAEEVEQEIRTTVIRVVEKEPGKFEAHITPDTVKLDNIPFGQKVDKSQFRPVRKCSDGPKK